MEKNMKSRIAQLGICVGLLCVIWGGYFLCAKAISHRNKMEKIKSRAEKVDYDFLFGIDEVMNEKDSIRIGGWVSHSEYDISELYVILKEDADSDECGIYKSELVKNSNHENVFGTSENYGFQIRIEEGKIDVDKCYEVQFSLFCDNADLGNNIVTNYYLYDRQMYRYNPKEFKTPVIADNSMNEVVKQGQVYAYDSEKEVWIYLFNNKMYCIANAEMVVPLEKVPSVPVGFYTWDDELVPEEIKENYLQNGFNSYEMYLDEGDLVSGEENQYYIVVVELPEYPLTYVRVGTYSNRGGVWLSRNEFQMDIEGR